MKMIVQQVAPEHVVRIWPQIEAFIVDALKYGLGEYNATQLKLMVIRREQTLLVALGADGKLHGACTVAFEDYPNERVAFVTSVGGHLMISSETVDQLKAWCRAQGCTEIRGNVRKSIGRLWRRYGFGDRYTVVGVKL